MSLWVDIGGVREWPGGRGGFHPGFCLFIFCFQQEEQTKKNAENHILVIYCGVTFSVGAEECSAEAVG